MYSEWVKIIIRALTPLAARNWIRVQKSKKISFMKRLIGKKQDFKNQEGFQNFYFTLFESRGKAGVSAMLRVKNEAEKIHYCLRSIFDIFDEIVFIDNGSEDKTLEIVRQLKTQIDKKNKIKIYCYPFKVARCGSENSNTPEDSVFSLAYYYNWCLSKCTFKYVCKWDADMFLRKEAREKTKRFFRQIQKDKKNCWIFGGQTIYRDLEGNYYLSKEEINQEIMIFPYGYNTRFYKIDLYEILLSQPPLPVGHFEGVPFYELKFANEDEFSHWSTNDFTTPRKKREWENYQLIKQGNVDSARFEKLSSKFLDEELMQMNSL